MMYKFILMAKLCLLAAFGIFQVNFPGSGSGKQVNISLTAEQVTDSLDKLGYFKYAAPENIEILKREIISGLIEHAFLSTVFNTAEPFNSLDFRHYSLDGEALFEQGGFTGMLKDMESVFSKMNVKMSVTNHSEEWDARNKWLNHRITINDKQYIVFKNFKGYGWGEAAQRFADIVNDQLKLQGSDERLFLSNGGNDGSAVFLTDSQYKLLDSILKGDTSRPLYVEDWCRVMRVKRAAITE